MARLTLAADGAQRFEAVLDPADLRRLSAVADAAIGVEAGARLFGNVTIGEICTPSGGLGRLAQTCLPGAFPVRAVIFGKTPANNWAVSWHQDRTIAVLQRIEVDGFGPWSTKTAVQHVAPPFTVLAGMITLRAHIDDCDTDNAPLLIAVGSHRLGKVAARDAEIVAARSQIEACLAQAGDVWAYSTSILHASEPAARPQRRRVLQVDFSAARLLGGLEWAGV